MRRARRAPIDDTVPSPCISLCQVDKQQARCAGCGRTLAEIRDWRIMTADQKRAVLDRLTAHEPGPLDLDAPLPG